MAKVLQTPQSPGLPGGSPATPLTLTLTAPNGTGSTNGDIVPANSIIYIENGNASPCVVTIKQPGLSSTGSGVTADPTVTVSATTGKKLIGPFPASFKQLPGTTDAGYVYLEYSIVATVTRAVLVTPF